MLWRMLCKCDTKVKQWEVDEAGSFDTAVKGSSALSAAIFRNLAEIAVLLDQYAGALFNDYMKFFDTVDVPTQIDRANRVNFPLAELSIILAQHLAPRMLQHDSACSIPIQIFRSILAGCAHSINLTRGLLKFDFQNLIDTNLDVTLETFVDDVPITSYHKSRLHFRNNIVKAARCYTKTCNDLKLVLSGKAYICLSDYKFTCIVAKALRKEHIFYQPVRSARDLGITYTAGVLHPHAGAC